MRNKGGADNDLSSMWFCKARAAGVAAVAWNSDANFGAQRSSLVANHRTRELAEDRFPTTFASCLNGDQIKMNHVAFLIFLQPCNTSKLLYFCTTYYMLIRAVLLKSYNLTSTR